MASSICLMRHGIAESGFGKPDFDRELTTEGRQRLAVALRNLRQGGIEFDVILASPLLRARQTAEIVASLGRSPEGVIITEALSPGATTYALLGELRIYAEASRYLIVGHQPDMSVMVAQLRGGRPGGTVDFRPGSMAWIDFPEAPSLGEGTLRWTLAADESGSLEMAT